MAATPTAVRVAYFLVVLVSSHPWVSLMEGWKGNMEKKKKDA